MIQRIHSLRGRVILPVRVRSRVVASRRTRLLRRVGLFLAWWMVFTLVYANMYYRLGTLSGLPAAWPENLRRALVFNGLWAVLVLAAFRLAQRFPLHRCNWKRVASIHLSTGAVLLVSRALVEHAISLRVDWLVPLPLEYRLLISPLSSAMLYFMVVGAAYGLLWARSYREGALQAAHLRVQLSAAHLQVMKMRMQPGVLFGALDAIRGFVRTDRETAVGMIARFGDMLRHALKRRSAHEIPLQEEVDALRHYLDIKRGQYGERLRVTWSIAPGTEAAMVPHLLLQPLTESVLRSGLAGVTDARLEISARRQGQVLNLFVGVEVASSGAGPEVVEPTALENARARLERLYGRAQRINAGTTTTGGPCVAFCIPYRLAEPPEPDQEEMIEAGSEVRESALPGWRRFEAGPEVGRGSVGAIVAGWFVLSVLLHGGAAYFRLAAHGNPAGYGWGEALIGGLTRTSTWAVIGAAAFVLVQKVPLPDTRWDRFLVLHLIAGAGLLVIHESITHLIAPWVSTLTPIPFVTRLGATTPVLALEYSSVLGIAYAIVYLRRLREQEILRLRLDEELTQAELQMLQAQLHPHFLFNALHAISELIYKDDADAAEHAILGLSDLLRQALGQSATQQVSLADELAFLRPYLQIEQIRFRDRIRTEWNIEPEVLDALVPHLLLQPIVENAIKHGLARRATPGCLVISAQRHGSMLRLQVHDSGSGGSALGRAAPGTGLGLSATRQRLKHLYGDAARLKIVVNGEKGTDVTIEIPLQYAASVLEHRKEAAELTAPTSA